MYRGHEVGLGKKVPRIDTGLSTTQSTSPRTRRTQGGKGQGNVGGIHPGPGKRQNPNLLSAQAGQGHAYRGDASCRE